MSYQSSTSHSWSFAGEIGKFASFRVSEFQSSEV
jgi:hypothetical protein